MQQIRHIAETFHRYVPLVVLDTEGSARPAEVALVPWPGDSDRRERCAEEGLLCLLVVEPGAQIPAVFEGEDWVYGSADERDVAARIEKLRRMGRRAPSPGPEILPMDMSAVQHRIASRLVASCGTLVRRDDLVVDDPEDLDQVVDGLRAALARDGWRISTIARSGFLIERPRENTA